MGGSSVGDCRWGGMGAEHLLLTRTRAGVPVSPETRCAADADAGSCHCCPRSGGGSGGF